MAKQYDIEVINGERYLIVRDADSGRILEHVSIADNLVVRWRARARPSGDWRVQFELVDDTTYNGPLTVLVNGEPVQVTLAAGALLLTVTCPVAARVKLELGGGAVSPDGALELRFGNQLLTLLAQVTGDTLALTADPADPANVPTPDNAQVAAMVRETLLLTRRLARRAGVL